MIVIYVTNMMVITKKMLLKVMLFMDISQALFFSMKFFNTRMGTETDNNVILIVRQT